MPGYKNANADIFTNVNQLRQLHFINKKHRMEINQKTDNVEVDSSKYVEIFSLL